MRVDETYLIGMKSILESGSVKTDRTGVGTISQFGMQMQYDLTNEFPILSTKKVPFQLVVSELLWFLKGDTNIRYLLQQNNHIWDEWAFERFVKDLDFVLDLSDYLPNEELDEMVEFQVQYFENKSLNARFKDEKFNELYHKAMKVFRKLVLESDDFAENFGNLGPVYGKQWRDFNGIDQIKHVINAIKTNPDSRRLIVNSWNPSEVSQMALPPCHAMFQFYVNNHTLDCMLTQRSGDYFLGVPFNIASYALLTHIIAKQCGLKVGKFVHSIGDVHVYQNHIEQCNEQLSRLDQLDQLPTPTLKEFDKKPIDKYEVNDFQLEHYQPMGAIKAPVAV